MNWPAILAGGIAGLVLIVPLVGIQLAATALSDDVPGVLVAVLFAGILVAFGVAGAHAGRRAPEAPRLHGALAGLTALAAWIPLRLALAVVADGDDALTGIGGAAGFALVMGTLGGLFGVRRVRE